MRILLYITGAILILLFAYLSYTAIIAGKEDQEVSFASMEQEEESFHKDSSKQQDAQEPLELSDASFPDTAILLDDRNSLIISDSDLREGQAKLLSNLGELPQGEYNIGAKDDSGQEQTAELNVNSQEIVSPRLKSKPISSPPEADFLQSNLPLLIVKTDREVSLTIHNNGLDSGRTYSLRAGQSKKINLFEGVNNIFIREMENNKRLGTQKYSVKNSDTLNLSIDESVFPEF